MNKIFLPLIVCCASINSFAQTFTHADTLRGLQTPERVWWNALKYDISIEFDPATQSLKGNNKITYVDDTTSVIALLPPVLQVDLMEPLVIDSAISDGEKLKFQRDGNAYFIKEAKERSVGEVRIMTIYYHGIPAVAKNPPWDGGVIWARDRNQNTWISIACEGFGASSWFPNKDQQLDEADSVEMHITVPNNLVGVANGRQSKAPTVNGDKTTYHWKVTNKINNYNIIPYIGKYESFGETFEGKEGPLDVTYWALQQDLQTAKNYWPSEMKETLKTLEKWFGPYPFYKDGFQLVESPHLGMEHQGAIAYGNKFNYGYLGHDLSESGWGLKWDYIILHETAHEWFGNSITAADAADMWIHESFATYAEVVYVEEHWGRTAGVDYVVGLRKNIQNDKPIIGTYNVNSEGSGDMYAKGANMIHTIRNIIDDDTKFKSALLEMNKKFYHRQTNSDEMIAFWSTYSSHDLKQVFDQYLKTAAPPTLSYSYEKRGKQTVMTYQWVDCIPGFKMPVKINVGTRSMWIYPTSEKQEIKSKKQISVSREFYLRQIVNGSRLF